MVDAQFAALPGVQKIRRGPLREQVRAQIKSLILTNYLRPGQIIVIDRLASDLGVSHTPVREALAMLQHDGLVTMRPYENPQVAEVQESDVHDAWDMRLLLEGWAVQKATQTLSDEDLDEIEHMLEIASSDAQKSRYEAHLQSDLKIHEMILTAVDNKLFDRLSQLVNDQSIRIRSLVEAIAPKEQVLEIIDEHIRLVDALRCRDSESARERLVAHLEAGKQRTLAALKEISEE